MHDAVFVGHAAKRRHRRGIDAAAEHREGVGHLAVAGGVALAAFGLGEADGELVGHVERAKRPPGRLELGRSAGVEGEHDPEQHRLGPELARAPPSGQRSSSAAGTAESSRIASKPPAVRLLSAAAQERDDLCFAAPRHPVRQIA